MPGRPPIDLNQKVRDLLQHTQANPANHVAPIRNFERRIGGSVAMLKYVNDHIDGQAVYQNVLDRHLSSLHRMVLVSLIEAFERFIKELAILCVDSIASYTIDNRFDQFSASAGLLSIQFDAGTVGRALCESDTWLSNQGVNERFRQLLKCHFDDQPWENLFPNARQQPAAERERAKTLGILWQLRHNITHNTGLLTDSDARRLTLMVKQQVAPGESINPSNHDLRYVERFLVETADRTNVRIAERLAELLTELHTDNPSLFTPQDKADSVSSGFQQSLIIAGAVGTL
ncbi:hypothetical protein [Planctomycetes bacterium TBK1r]|uniref:RiboL-PSP-HEPN domain-containing protein n=1 Tax=Stieleria magnilauensis TaxID=2527963 RepID=A0ABX5XWJ3_9BACT|nr:hypothetical protein TBK1r_48210 [Planctomycetes bacterium TBK1r]